MLEPMPKTLYKAEDLYDLEGDYELDEGVLIPMSNGSFEHGVVCLNVGVTVRHYVKANALGRVAGNDSGCVLQRNPDTVRGPDVTFISTARLQERNFKFYEGAPDLAIEVLSSGDRAGAVARKVAQYLRTGCRLVWVIGIPRRELTVHRANGTVEKLSRNDTVSGEDVLPGFACTVAALIDLD